MGSCIESGSDPEMGDKYFGTDDGGNNGWSIVENRKRKTI